MPNYQFGSGTLFATPIGGNLGANPTPMQFGTLQDVSLDISFDMKELWGQNQFAEAIGRGKGKIAGKAKYAKLHGKMINDLFWGMTTTVGQKLTNLDFAASVPGVSTYIITITPPNSGVFNEDEGVRNASTGDPLTKVPSAPAQGQYSLSGAVYTFAAADANLAVLVSYNYTVATGLRIPVTNSLMGSGPVFKAVLRESFVSNGVTQQSVVTLYSCSGSKLTRATKQEDFLVPEFDFIAFANAAGQVIDFDEVY
jgi:hypothetical protein